MRPHFSFSCHATRKRAFLYAVLRLIVFYEAALYGGDFAEAQTGRVVVEQIMCFGKSRNALFLGVHGFSLLKNRSIVVSDKLENTVKKLNAHGEIVHSARYWGQGTGLHRGPGPCSSWRNFLAIADFANSRILILDTSLQERNQLIAPGPVADLKFDTGGNLWVSVYTGDKGRELFEVDLEGKPRKVISLKNTTGDMFDDVVVLSVDSKGSIGVGYLTRNIVEIWDTSGQFVRQLSIPCLPIRSPRVVLNQTFYGNDFAVPQGEVIRSITQDNQGNIFVLGGSLAERPEQTVIVLNSLGQYIDQFVLPSKAFVIHAGGDGFFYSLEQDRTQIQKYRLSIKRSR